MNGLSCDDAVMPLMFVSLARASEMERLHGEWLAWTCCDATDVCLLHALVNRAFAWGLAGFHVL